MSRYWLSTSTLDRYVIRLLRRLSSSDEKRLCHHVCNRLRGDGLVQVFQKLPDENDIWCSLQRLSAEGKVKKYVFESATVDRHIRYRVCEK
jgi:hypothetical protein